MTDAVRLHSFDTVEHHQDGRLYAPASDRNIVPIVAALEGLLAGRAGLMLEIGCGTGQHGPVLAQAFPDLEWQPSDPYEVYLASTRARAADHDLTNLRDPIQMDAAGEWPDLGPLAGALAVNILHVTPWRVAEGIFRGAGQALAPNGLLLVYGAVRESGHTADSNEAFDAGLRRANPDWGLRDTDDLAALARENGLTGPELIEMPSNNRLMVFRKA